MHAVLPGDVDDPARVSGGNVYDRRVLDALRARGATVVEHALPGAWPRPGEPARAGLHEVLAGLDDGATVLLDGLVAGGVPGIAREARRLRLAVLVHLPLGEEPGTADLAAGEGEVLRAATAVVATSPWAARRLAARDGVDAHVVVPGVDAAPLAPGTDGVRRVVCVGALTPTKGQDLLVDALPDGLELDLVGPVGRDPEFAADLERRRGATVRLRGPRPRDEAFRDADLVVVPSRTETYGMVVAEALARGVAVLAADVGGLAETLGGAGELVRGEDVGALAAALRRWRDDPAHRARLRALSRARRGTLPSWDAAAAALAAAIGA
jgi:glycosyltransferase involved in cell wall biosynthesis